jgi:alkanesulfonate monooxygenase SsuD/methylene tetrahydromethanopterin reductase-like flavin-dependent oxidoreductase (luciferase family)
VHLDQVSPQGAIAFLETVWGRDLSDHDPDGPLPAFDPDVEGGESITRGRVRMFKDPVATAQQWRDLAESKHLTIRELVIEVSARETFVGSPKQVAAQIDDAVQQDAADGYILVPYLTPHGLDEFIDRVVPELQDRGAFRTEYEHDTLRGNLGLGAVR